MFTIISDFRLSEQRLFQIIYLHKGMVLNLISNFEVQSLNKVIIEQSERILLFWTAK